MRPWNSTKRRVGRDAARRDVDPLGPELVVEGAADRRRRPGAGTGRRTRGRSDGGRVRARQRPPLQRHARRRHGRDGAVAAVLVPVPEPPLEQVAARWRVPARRRPFISMRVGERRAGRRRVYVASNADRRPAMALPSGDIVYVNCASPP
ncbi:MAG: hypothetical protein MZV64_13480 [Ignavibacteriales bacterium]|nr:hypothetical protein [Ignavibacteriales bacterium]